jgi:DNA-binding PadR family transcriptional regulator
VRVPIPDDLILGLLWAGPQHGYELLAHFDSPRELGRVWTMSRSQVYAVLKRLEQERLIRGRSVRGEDAPDRVVYEVTAAGRRRVDEWLYASPLSASVRAIRVEFISRLHIADLLGRATTPIIDRQRDLCDARLASLQQARRTAETTTERRSLDFVVGQLSAVISWLDGLREDDRPIAVGDGSPTSDVDA